MMLVHRKLLPLMLFVVLLSLGFTLVADLDVAAQEMPVEPLDPTTIPKFVSPLIIPPVMAPTGTEGGAITYTIAARQFKQQVLPDSLPMTTVWGYGNPDIPESFHFPAFTIETRRDERLRITWLNQLVDDPTSAAPEYLPHLLPVDQTLHWANPVSGPDKRGSDTEAYTGPVPIVTHVHGAHVADHSDGFPEAWMLPDAVNIPEGFPTRGTRFMSQDMSVTGGAVYEYTNDQRAATLWYHDHALGMTRLNVYSGLAGFWIIRDEVEDILDLPGPAPQLGDAENTQYYEIPIVIQDRSFNSDGSLWYPDNRTFFDAFDGPFFPDSPIAPLWNPEFFGNTIVVNGRTWPYLEVEPRVYRFRLLNGTNSRFLLLDTDAEMPFTQIGTEGGLLPDAPIELDQLLMAPAERADIIMDFSEFAPGDEILLRNLGPDEPFGGLPVERDAMANPQTTGQVMLFRVVEASDDAPPSGAVPERLPPIERLESDLPVRQLTLNEEMYLPDDVPVAALLGTSGEGPLTWSDEITENPVEGDTEIWNIINLTGDAHPVHLHLVMFQVVERVPFDPDAFHEAQEAYLLGRQAGPAPDPLNFATGDPRPPEAWETGWKDTVIALPGEVTRIIAKFDLAGLYVWHCHILEHEDNEMMRPYEVLPRES